MTFPEATFARIRETRARDSRRRRSWGWAGPTRRFVSRWPSSPVVTRFRYLAPGERGVVGLVANAGDGPDSILTLNPGETFQLAVALDVAVPVTGYPRGYDDHADG